MSDLFNGTRVTQIPDALAPFERASAAEQMRRVRVVLEGAARMHRRGVASLAGCLFVVERAPKVPSAPVEAARRLLCAVAGTTDLQGWEQRTPRAEVRSALKAALAHCAPSKRSWLAEVGSAS